MGKMLEAARHHRPAIVLMVCVLMLSFIPPLDIALVLGNDWRGILPTFTDETFYHARVQAIIEGHAGGNPYFFEHRDDAPLVIFAGTWVNAIPQLLGLSLHAALMVNFIIWSFAFAIILYWLFRELRVPSWIAVGGTIWVYLESYAHVWRPVNLQPVYPFYFLFYIALLRLIREQSRRHILFLGIVTGATFYFFAYLWQTAVITLGLLVLYALVCKNWPLMKAAILSSGIGGIIGLPVPLYALWLSHTSPYFWESVGRLGLVNTHLPMAEIIYSGGWIGILLMLLVLLWRRVPLFREDREFTLTSAFIAISGLGLWVMQGSNLFTGKLLETGEHVRLLILPWLIFSSIGIGFLLWRRRTQLSRNLKVFSIAVLLLLLGVSMQVTYQRFLPFIPAHVDRSAWQLQQKYAKPFVWLENAEKSPVVVWSEPRHYLSTVLPIFTRHYTLYTYFGMLELVPEGEIRERYLISQYFNGPTAARLATNQEMELYLGRHDFPHAAKTKERGIKICRILSFWNTHKDCGVPPSPQELMGATFFMDLEQRFQADIKPNIKAYLKKYNISYILKDKVLDPQYRPEILGAIQVYADDRYEIWKL